jgi:hypothetical protein
MNYTYNNILDYDSTSRIPQARFIDSNSSVECNIKNKPNYVPFNINLTEFVKDGNAEKFYDELSQSKCLEQGALISEQDLNILKRLHQQDIKDQKNHKIKNIISYFYTQKR